VFIALTEASEVTLIVAFMGLIATIVSAWLSHGAKREATGANQAVNKVGPDETPLKERVASIETTVRQQGDTLEQILDAVTKPGEGTDPR
jgi:Co/Zn/Cd efflux system component